ncbi:hypothetical protein A11A3_07078 [Alcanivorax hongdengensis A-11-3]|uniref:DUF4331 domain-containing protein n=2 Tax=Alcanivorax hongdengensis TaxID=519051 RepID=L0WCS9_9GAMM|nr:hypothetical protein A11A3_07078 [Alcanivorax hongdengensis A-11-3]
MASSHREAPFITGMPKVDGTDFYMFRSYESGREDYVTLIANYLPLQDAYGGPNYFALDDKAVYEIHIDNDGDAREDLTYQFHFNRNSKDATVDVDGKDVPVPLINIGPVTGNDSSNQNVQQTFTVKLIEGDRRKGHAMNLTQAGSGSQVFVKPLDNIGNKSISDYATYADNFIYDVTIPDCPKPGRLFVGQRKDGFVVNLGEVFDLVNLNPLGARDSRSNAIGDKNVTSLALEVPSSCLTGGNSVIGGWTTASVRQARILNPAPQGSALTGSTKAKGASVEGGAYTQVSRLGNPLVNEVVIGLPDKDRFNASEPKDDTQFASYVTNPSLPALVQVLFNVPAPHTPRNDLVTVFLTGVPGVTQLPTVTASEMLRLNTAIPATAAGSQSDLGVAGGDFAGFPNGRRPIDDVVDIALTAAEGYLCGADLNGSDAGGEIGSCGDQDSQVNGGAIVNDGAKPDPADYLTTFPYLNTPLPGANNP